MRTHHMILSVDDGKSTQPRYKAPVDGMPRRSLSVSRDGIQITARRDSILIEREVSMPQYDMGELSVWYVRRVRQGAEHVRSNGSASAGLRPRRLHMLQTRICECAGCYLCPWRCICHKILC